MSYLPQWLVDVSTIMTIVGFLITVLGLVFTFIIFNQTREIKLKFISKARLPQLTEELSNSSSEILRHLRQKDIHFELLTSEFFKCAGLIESILLKLDNSNNTKAKSLLAKLRCRRFLIGPYSYIQITDVKQAWKIYSELGGLTTSLTQKIKDSHWD